MRQRPGDLAAARLVEHPAGPSPKVKVPVQATGGNKTPDAKPCARGAAVVVRGTCVLSQGSVALGKESFESGACCKPDVWAQRAGDTWADDFPGRGHSPRQGPGAGLCLSRWKSWEALVAGAEGAGGGEPGVGHKQVMQGLVSQGGSPDVCRAGKGCVET